MAGQIFPESTSEQRLTSVQSLACFLHGTGLNLITISEYSWKGHTSLLDHYLDMLLTAE